jgi:cardiolipin synthase (CMP-forming)
MLPRCLSPILLRSVNVQPLVAYRNGFRLQGIRQPWTGSRVRLTPTSRVFRQFSTCRELRIEHDSRPSQKEDPKGKLPIRENIYTLPNLLTVSRILSCPILGWSILNNDFYLATGLLVFAGASDLVRPFVCSSSWGRS